MTRNENRKKKGLGDNLVFRSLVGGGVFFTLFTFVTIIFPYRSDYYLFVSGPIGVVGFLSYIWLTVQPQNLYARFFWSSALASLLTLIAYRGFKDLLPEFYPYSGSFIILTIVFAHVFPLWRPSTANFIRGELMAPKTLVGKIVFRISLLVIPFAAIIGASLGTYLPRTGKITAFEFIFGIVCWLAAAILPFSSRSPSSPWEVRQ